MWVSWIGSHQGRFTMDIITNGRRLWRLVGLYASLILQIIIVLYGLLHIDSSLAGTSKSVLPNITKWTDITELSDQTDSNYDKDDEWDTDFLKHSNLVEIDRYKKQILEASHQTLDLHDLDKHSSSHKQRHLMAVAMAGLAYEVATIMATDAAVTLNSLAILLAGLKSLQSHTCNNSDNAYAFNQKDVCKSVSGKSINIREDIIEPYTTVAKLFHEDPNSKLRMIETNNRIYIYLPDGNNIALPRDYVEKGDELWQKYNKFKTNFTKTADFVCNGIVEGRQCGVFTYDKETLIEDYKKVFPLFHKTIQLDSKIVTYHKNSLTCTCSGKRNLMRNDNNNGNHKDNCEDSCVNETSFNDDEPEQNPEINDNEEGKSNPVDQDVINIETIRKCAQLNLNEPNNSEGKGPENPIDPENPQTQITHAEQWQTSSTCPYLNNATRRYCSCLFRHNANTELTATAVTGTTVVGTVVSNVQFENPCQIPHSIARCCLGVTRACLDFCSQIGEYLEPIGECVTGACSIIGEFLAAIIGCIGGCLECIASCCNGL